jgi:hypothetical protein
MRLTKVKLVAIVVAPLLSGACFVAAAHYLMSDLEPARTTVPSVGSANACLPDDAPIHKARHGRPLRREGACQHPPHGARSSESSSIKRSRARASKRVGPDCLDAPGDPSHGSGSESSRQKFLFAAFEVLRDLPADRESLGRESGAPQSQPLNQTQARPSGEHR